MNEILQSDFQRARRRWLEHIAGVVVVSPELSRGAPNGTDMNAVETALLEIHVGLGHIMGVDRDETAIGGLLDPNTVDRVVGRWRAGDQSIAAIGELKWTWASLWYAGVWNGAVRDEISAALDESVLSERLNIAGPGRDPLPALWAEVAATVAVPTKACDDIWDCASSHLGALTTAPRWSAEHLPSLLPLEQRAIRGARREPLLEASVELSTQQIHLSHVEDGGWGGPGRGDVPRWLRDYVIAHGGRNLQDQAGVVPCWFVVAESPEMLRALSNWRYAQGPVAVAHDPGSPNEVLIRLELDLQDGLPNAYLDFHYNTNRSNGAASLDLLAWNELVRLEVYSVEKGELEFAFSWGVHLPGIRVPVTDQALRSFPESNWIQEAIPDSTSILGSMRNSQRVQYELIRRGEAARRAGTVDASRAYESYLLAIHHGAQAESGGLIADQLSIDRAHRELRAQLSLIADPVPEVELDHLASTRALVQLHPILDEPIRVAGAFAVNSSERATEAGVLTFLVQDFLNGGMAIEDDAFELLSPKGVTSLVLSPSGSLLTIPLHEDFLALGFSQTSYAHRTGVIAPAGPTSPPGADVVVAGWPGKPGSADFLDKVENEFLTLEKVYGVARRPLDLARALPRIVHISGHGDAARSATGHWLRASPGIDDLLTPSRVLLDADANSTDLVFLSACSSGRGVFSNHSVMEAVPLEVAFLEKGATCVVSTIAPVNDTVAAAFSIAFHVSWNAGASVWDAYLEARKLTSTSEASPTVIAALEANWPGWRKQLRRGSAAFPDDWKLFKLSGRHWQ